MKARQIYQLQGPFKSNMNILPQGGKIKLGIAMQIKDLMPYGDQSKYPHGFSFKINNKIIQMGRTGMYETDDYVTVSSLSFDYDTPPSVIVTYVTGE